MSLRVLFMRVRAKRPKGTPLAAFLSFRSQNFWHASHKIKIEQEKCSHASKSITIICYDARKAGGID